MRRQNLLVLVSVALALLAVLAFGTGCKNQFLEKPSFGNPEASTENNQTTNGAAVSFGAPAGLTSTQGGYREITLSWDSVKDAVRYNVYRASTQFDTFVQVGETAGEETTYTMKVASGADYYYRVTAVSHSGEQSPFSSIVRGTSLATPLISAIEGVEGKEDSDVTVYWYMGNVDAYQNQVRYNVICYDAKGTELARVVVDGSKSPKTEAVIPNLIPNTDYQYKIEAFLVTAQDKVEAGDPMDAATARRLRPNAPEELKVEQGQSKDGITLTFKLPALVDVALPGGLYEQKPLYFKIYRREFVEGSTDTEKGWELVKADFGKTDTKPGEGETQKVKFGSDDEDYTPGKVMSWTDGNKLNRGVRYEYKVQSFAYYERDITSKYSASIATGWLVAKADFGTGEYTPVLNEEQTANVSSTLGFRFAWDTLGLDDEYHFILTETRYSLEKDEEDCVSKEKESKFEKLSSVSDVNQYKRTFNGLDNNDMRGYYKYRLAIMSHDNVEILVLETLGRAIVTDDVDLPVIKLFSATSGYNDKIELQWQHNPKYSYTVSYSSDGEKAQTIDDTTLYANQKRDTLQEDAIVTYIHNVSPGKKYAYKLTVTENISVDSLPIVASTSKAPAPTMGNPSYDAITVSWEDVPATALEVSASYNDRTVASKNTIESQELDGNDEENLSKVPRTVTFSHPAGYSDATVSGMPLTVTVAAEVPVTRTVHTLLGDSGSSYKTTTEDVKSIKLSGSVAAATMGPALVNATTSVGTYSDKITLNWNKVEGATAYMILRTSLHISSKSSGNNLLTEFENTDKFIVTDVDSTPSITLDPAPNDVTFVKKHLSVAKTDTGFILTDNLCRQESSDATLGKWLRSQSQLSWGAPYEYIVLPLLSAQDTIEYDYETAPAVATVDTVTLTSVRRPAGATKGYAWNVKATKGTYSENGENTGVKLTWTRPWAIPEHSYTIFRADSTKSEWEQLPTVVDKNDTCFIDKTALPGTMYQYMIAPAVNEKMYYPYNNAAYNKHFDGIQDKDYSGERLANGFMLPQVEVEVTKKNLNTHVDMTWSAPETAEHKNYLFEGYVIEVLNNNIDDQWHEVATLTFGDSIEKIPSYNYSVRNQEKNLLKVLRDYKFYFRIRTYVTDDNGDRLLSKAPDYTWSDGGETKYVEYGMRQVSLEEFAKMALVNLVEPQETYRGNDGYYSTRGEIKVPQNGNEKAFNSSNQGAGPTYYSSDYNSYTAQPLTRAGRRVSGLTLQGKLQGDKSTAIGTAFPRRWWSGNTKGDDPFITVTYPGYGTGTIKLKMYTTREEGAVEVSYNGDSWSYGTSSEILKKLPLPLHGDGSFSAQYNTEYWK